MNIEAFELAPGSWILAIGIIPADRGVAGLVGKTASATKYDAAWSTSEKWNNANLMTFPTLEAAEQFRAANLAKLTDAPVEF